MAEATRSAAPTLRELLETVFRRAYLLLIVIPAVLLVTLLITLSTHKTYQSQMKILVQNNRSNVILTADKTTATTAADVTEQQINSEIEILHSRDVLDQVIDPGWNGKSVASRPVDEVKRHDRQLMDLERHLGTEPVRKSNVITVTCQGISARSAQTTLQNLATSFLSEQRRLLRPTGTTEFLNSEAEKYRDQWDRATAAFVQFQQANGVVALPDTEESLAKQIVASEDQVRLLDVGVQEMDARVSASRQALSGEPERQTTSVKTLPYQQSAQELNTLIATLENKRAALLTGLKPADRLVTEVDRQIALTREALHTVEAGSAVEKTTDINPSYQAVTTKRIEDTVSRASLVAQRNRAAQQLGQLRARLNRVQALTVDYNLLKSRADNLKENYLLYTQKQEQAQIEDAMDDRKLLNVSIAEHPTFSYLPVSPRPMMNLALGLVSACFLAGILVYFAELGRATIATPRELETATGKPVLATVPMVRGGVLVEEDGPMHFIHVTNGNALRAALARAAAHVVPGSMPPEMRA